MLYALFLVLAIVYNLRKFSKEKVELLRSLVEATSQQHRDMILSHHFHVFIFESFLATIVCHLISEGSFAIGLVGFGAIYLVMLGMGLLLYQYFVGYLEKLTSLSLRTSFNQHVIKEFRVSFGLIMVPILLYSILNWTFMEEEASEVGNLWILGFLTNIILVSVLTIVCTVIIMLRLIPNREITEPEYLKIIDKHLARIGMPKMRVHWIESDIKNAFVVGLKILRFSNQTMFIGRKLRTMLTLEEFDAVIAHELAHVANRHINKRVIELLKNFVSAIIGTGLLLLTTLTIFHLYFGEDMGLYERRVALVCIALSVLWFFGNYAIFFDTIRSHEYEADAYAVLELGADFSAFQSALHKLTQTDEMPDYVLQRKPKASAKHPLLLRLAKIFSTHPTLEERIQSLEYKIQEGLAFNHYVSPVQKFRTKLAWTLQWKVSVPLVTSFVASFIWGTVTVKDGGRLVSYIRQAEPMEILQNEELKQKINKKPFIVGRSLMYYIVARQDPMLIDHFLEHGGDPGRTLIYLSETKNFDMFKGYYLSLKGHISQDEYFLVLLRTADVNFTDGYRYLVNSPKFEELSQEFKADIARIHRNKSQHNRAPASEK